MQDTTIMYQGGSGGYLLFYYMLLTGNYTAGIDMSILDENINKQFPDNLSSYKKDWKSYEVFPDNLLCKNTPTNINRLFLICQPINKNSAYYEFTSGIVPNTKVILLYTDLHTQLRMCYDKKAYFFYSPSYSQIKINNPHLTDREYIRNILKSGVIWRGEFCDPELPKIEAEYPNLNAINLRDIIQDTNKTPKQQQLVDRWLSLHNKKALRRLI